MFNVSTTLKRYLKTQVRKIPGREQSLAKSVAKTWVEDNRKKKVLISKKIWLKTYGWPQKVQDEHFCHGDSVTNITNVTLVMLHRSPVITILEKFILDMMWRTGRISSKSSRRETHYYWMERLPGTADISTQIRYPLFDSRDLPDSLKNWIFVIKKGWYFRFYLLQRLHLRSKFKRWIIRFH